MGGIRLPRAVTLIAGLLAGAEELLARARAEMQRLLGTIQFVSDVWPFDATHYYERELGPTILRQFVSFEDPFPMDRLPQVKQLTNELETDLIRDLCRPDGLRPVNVDPGYVTLASLVLATTKDRAHRIYLGMGIFAEVTLLYESGVWRACPWTYPDYAATTYHQFFTRVRDDLKRRLRSG